MILRRLLRRSSSVKIFDPGSATVVDVKAYIAANPADAERVLAAERAGKNRRSIVGRT